MALLFISINFLPTSITFMIFNINPIFVALLAYFLLHEKLTSTSLACVVGAFMGVVIVGLGRKDKITEGKHQIVGVITCFLSALSASVAYICMKKVNQEIHYIFSPYYLNIASLLLIIPIYLIDSDLIHLHWTYKNMGYLFFIGLFALAGQILLSVAYKYGNASTVSPLMYINCLFNIFIDLLYFNFPFYWTDVIGAVLITGCLSLPVFILYRSHSGSK